MVHHVVLAAVRANVGRQALSKGASSASGSQPMADVSQDNPLEHHYAKATAITLYFTTLLRCPRATQRSSVFSSKRRGRGLAGAVEDREIAFETQAIAPIPILAPELATVLEFLRPGDELVVTRLDRNMQPRTIPVRVIGPSRSSVKTQHPAPRSR